MSRFSEYRCPWCRKKQQPARKTSTVAHLDCECGHWTEYYIYQDANQICATGKGEEYTEIKWNKKVRKKRIGW